MYCLLIDDDIPTIDVLKDMIDWSKFGINEVMSAHNIYDAKRLFKQKAPDVVICDIEMPKGSGLEMIEWVRQNQYDCAFIFFTCHESFEFASVAITFHADAYVTKPFERSKLEVSLLKSTDSLHKRRQQDQYSRYGQSWLNNKTRIEQGFWHEILFKRIIPREDFIQAEIMKRDIDIEFTEQYRLALVCVSRSELILEWMDTSFQYAFRNICSEVVYGAVDHPRLISYQVGSNYYIAMILEGEHTDSIMKEKLEEVIIQSQKLLRGTVTCYWSDIISISWMEKTRTDLERMDKENIIFRGKAHAYQSLSYQISQPYKLDVNCINEMFIRKERVQIVNFLKNELQRLTALNKLDLNTIRTIHSDFMQIVYSLLYKNNIQAHPLFADEAARQLDKEANSNSFNLMKWVAYVTNKAIDCLKEAADSDGTVNKIKRYIHEHYHEELNREKLAEIVYLTPDYLAKRFKSEVGLSITEYLNDYRIKVAKEKLLQDNESIGDIAINTGFDSISYFSTVFKKMTGISPSVYRTQHKTPN